MLKVGDIVFNEQRDQWGIIEEIDTTCYRETHSFSDPWVTIEWVDKTKNLTRNAGVLSRLKSLGWAL